MVEWLYEEGIGENRAILVEGDHILEAVIELPKSVRAGSILKGRLTAILTPTRGIVALDKGGECLVEPLPSSLTEGAALRVEIARESLAESGRFKLPRGRITSEEERTGLSLRDRIATSGEKVAVNGTPGADRFEEAGWSELLEGAASGEIAFPGGALRMSLTPAMTLFDVDGALPPAALAVAGAAAAGRAIRRFGIGGSIGVDLPTLPSKQDRQAAAAALDDALPQPFERTAVNGFGFLQIVRKRERASLPELLEADPVGAAARALLRQAERAVGAGLRTLHGAPLVAERIERHPDWLELLARRTGTAVALRADPELTISAGHVDSQYP